MWVTCRVKTSGGDILLDGVGKTYEPFAVSDGYMYFRRQVEPEVRYTPEAQKVQDAAKAEQAYKRIAEKVDYEVLTAPREAAIRAQAIKDVGVAMDNRFGPNFILDDVDMGKVVGKLIRGQLP